MADNEEIKIVINADDRASGVLSNVGKSASGLGGILKGMGVAAGAAAIGGIALLTKSALKAGIEYEQSQIAFETMLGSASKAQGFLKDLTDFAKKTPFELTGLKDAAKSLLAYGIEQEKVIPDLKSLGDIAAGVGMDKLPNLILAFGQVSAKGKLMGDDLRQFTSAGIPLLAQLGQSMGKSTAEIQEMVTAGQIGFPEVEAALAALSGEGGRFANLMDKQSQSLGGMISNIKDSIGIMMSEIGTMLVPKVKPIVDWFMQNMPLIKSAIVGAISGLFDFGSAIVDLVNKIYTQLKPSFDLLWIVIQQQILPVFQELWNAIKNDLWPAIQELWQALLPFMPLLEQFAKILGIAVVAAILIAVVALTKLLTVGVEVLTFLTNITTFISKVVVAAWKNFEDSIVSVINSFKSLIDIAKKAKDAVTGFIDSKAVSSVGKALGFRAAGGPVTSGSPYIVGERGPELFVPNRSGTIIPNSGLAGAPAGGIQIFITGTFMSEDAAEIMGNKMIDRLKLQLRI